MRIRRWIFAGIIILAAGYFFYEAKGVIFAPRLEILEPKDGATVSGGRLRVVGRASPNLSVWIAGISDQSGAEGVFQEDIPVFPGYNEIGVLVKDRLGSETRKILRVVVK